MTIQKIMVPFLKKDTGLTSLEIASTLAQRFKAHLDVVYMRPPIDAAYLSGGYYPIAVNYVQSTIDAMKEKADKQAQELKKIYEDFCLKSEIEFYNEEEHTDDKGVTAAWSDIEPLTARDYSKRGRVADMTVVAQADDDPLHDEVSLIEELVFESGRPVLIGRNSARGFKFPETIIVAWDGGREAAQAIAASMAFLKAARLVIVASIGGVSYGCAAPDEAVSHLKLQGVHATALTLGCEKGEDAHEAFLNLARDKNADLIVMGAYSHSRLREVIWGGFTRYLLRESEIPLFMAH